MPVDRVHAQTQRYPTQWGDDVAPLSKYIKPKDPRAANIIKQVGGKGRAGAWCDAASTWTVAGASTVASSLPLVSPQLRVLRDGDVAVLCVC